MNRTGKELWIKIDPTAANAQAYATAYKNLPRRARRQLDQQAKRALRRYRREGIVGDANAESQSGLQVGQERQDVPDESASGSTGTGGVRERVPG